MFGRAFLIGALLAAGASIPAMAQQQRPKTSDYGTKKICKIEGQVGSRLRANRTCRTQAEWDQIAVEGRRVAERILTGACIPGSNEPGKPGIVCGN